MFSTFCCKSEIYQRSGPLIVSEVTGLPYRENYYATDWRSIAKSAGVPQEVWSMDARAGAISEAEEATGSLDAARKTGRPHQRASTTLGYVRNDDLDNNRKVAEGAVETAARERLVTRRVTRQ